MQSQQQVNAKSAEQLRQDILKFYGPSVVSTTAVKEAAIWCQVKIEENRTPLSVEKTGGEYYYRMHDVIVNPHSLLLLALLCAKYCIEGVSYIRSVLYSFAAIAANYNLAYYYLAKFLPQRQVETLQEKIADLAAALVFIDKFLLDSATYKDELISENNFIKFIRDKEFSKVKLELPIDKDGKFSIEPLLPLAEELKKELQAKLNACYTERDKNVPVVEKELASINKEIDILTEKFPTELVNLYGNSIYNKEQRDQAWKAAAALYRKSTSNEEKKLHHLAGMLAQIPVKYREALIGPLFKTDEQKAEQIMKSSVDLSDNNPKSIYSICKAFLALDEQVASYFVITLNMQQADKIARRDCFWVFLQKLCDLSDANNITQVQAEINILKTTYKLGARDYSLGKFVKLSGSKDFLDRLTNLYKKLLESNINVAEVKVAAHAYIGYMLVCEKPALKEGNAYESTVLHYNKFLKSKRVEVNSPTGPNQN
jgi:hypothetical protein